MKALPDLRRNRYKHCSIIIRDYLFIFFGYPDLEGSPIDTLEFLDLSSDQSSHFNELKIEGYF